MKLFAYEGFKVVIEPEALMLGPFKALWDRDKSETKERAMMELALVFFQCDSRSDYQHIVDPAKRLEEVKKGEGLPAKWKPDKVVEAAMKFYESFKTPAALLLDDTRLVVDKIRGTLRTMDVEKEDLKDVAATVQKLVSLIMELDKADRALAQEAKAEVSARGSQEMSILDAGLA